MSISPVSSQTYASLLTGLSGSTNSTAGTTASSGSIGDQLLAELSQSQSSSATSSSDPCFRNWFPSVPPPRDKTRRVHRRTTLKDSCKKFRALKAA
jgi:hypothetical protein